MSPGNITLMTTNETGQDTTDRCAVCGTDAVQTAHWDNSTGVDIAAWSCTPEHAAIIESRRDADGILRRQLPMPYVNPASALADVPMADPNKIEDWECSLSRHATEHQVEFADDLVPSGTQWKIMCSEHGVTNGIPAKRFRLSGGAR